VTGLAVDCSPDLRSALADLAPLFRFPRHSYRATVGEALRITDVDGASDALRRFAAEIETLDDVELETIYTATFDLSPSCSPYLGVHLFGAETPHRSRLMLGLRLTYGTAEVMRELPDHIGEVLSFATRYESEEWRELLRFVLQPALRRMESLLSSTSNPFRHLVAAASRLCAVASEGGLS
jgi:nitrate reductase molybdenum cofactor assembly chaperone